MRSVPLVVEPVRLRRPTSIPSLSLVCIVEDSKTHFYSCNRWTIRRERETDKTVREEEMTNAEV